MINIMSQEITQISPYLYIGPTVNEDNDDNQKQQYNLVTYLKQKGVTVIINCGETSPSSSSFEYFHYPMTNTDDSTLVSSLVEANKHIYELISGGVRVYVQCTTGNLLAPTLAIMFMMKTWNLSFDRSITLVKSRRPTVKLSQNLIELVQKC
jgi:hypothetical protein